MESVGEMLVKAIEIDIVESFSGNLASYYQNPPGRNPGPQARRMQEIINRLDAEDSKILIKDVVDRAVAATLSLIDQDFKENNIRTTFSRGSDSLRSGDLLRLYRDVLDPGGLPRS